MKTSKYSKASAEVLDILKYTKKEDTKRIPKEFMQFLEENSSEEYISNLDHTKQIKDMNLGQETQDILGLIYLKYWAEEQEKEKFRAKIREIERIHQEQLRERYNPDDLFRKKEETIKEIENTKFPETMQKQTVIKRIINSIKQFLGGKR